MQINPQKINKNAIEVCRVLTNYGYKAYIVGGCVRDLLLDMEPKDWDIATNAEPSIIQKVFEKTYPTGLQHGTVTVAMNEEHFEVTTFRVEGDYLDGRRPSEVQFVNKIEDDLGRRDITINAMAYDPMNNELVDPYEGVKDLENKVIRCVGSAIDRLTEDGLRIMRIARFAARFEYVVGYRTSTAMSLAVNTLKKVSVERIADELKKLLMTNNPTLGLTLLLDTGALQIVCPNLIEHYKYSIPDFLFGTYKGDVETRIAKLYTHLPIDIVKDELIDLKLSNKEIKRILFMLSLNNNFSKQFGINNKDYNTDDFYIELLSSIKNDGPDTYEYSLKQFNEFLISNGRYEFLDRIKNLKVFGKKEMLLNGCDLLALGFKPGREIKKCLNEAYSLILKNPEKNSVPSLYDFAIGYLEKINNL